MYSEVRQPKIFLLKPEAAPDGDEFVMSIKQGKKASTRLSDLRSGRVELFASDAVKFSS
jgi:hypothetical protein